VAFVEYVLGLQKSIVETEHIVSLILAPCSSLLRPEEVKFLQLHHTWVFRGFPQMDSFLRTPLHAANPGARVIYGEGL
jgi:hypothetical protein